MEFLMDPSIWVGLATLVVLEIVLGIDNLVFIAILADKLPPHQRDKARRIGLALALIMRLGLLSIMSWVMKLTTPLFNIADFGFSGRDLILIFGGLFLVWKATMELHEKLEGKIYVENKNPVYAGIGAVITQIVILDSVFSLDSVITAVGMVDNIYVMMVAVIIAMGVMLLASKPLTRFVNQHPTVVMLCLSFLLMIGFSLIAEGFGLHIPKGYLYAAIGFSILIESLNQWRIRNFNKNTDALPLRARTADAILTLMGGRRDTTPSSIDDPSPALAFDEEERYMVSGVLTLSERSIRTIMTPRADISWIDINGTAERIREQLLDTPHSLFPVCRDQLDRIVGVVRAKDLIDILDHDLNIADLVGYQRPIFVSETMPVLKLINILRNSKGGLAIVTNEFGSVQGLVTPLDIFEAIAGEFPDEDETPDVIQQDEHTWLVKGSADLYQLEQELGTNHLLDDEGYISVAGLILNELGRLPTVGEVVARGNVSFTVLELAEQRIHLLKVELDDHEV
ncbi:TerC family protein [Aquirhabdus parva]|uniref:TerC family protein n=1 Tax=Aquirhabdus parva TaxID=2283318 RepID=A0A345P9X7_9GAMM|nr:TerC family protein [Aquirhabdus parva]AXI04086.1 TerC family protein [Aquirhabdus parva]